MLDTNFNTATYELVLYTGGGYALNPKNDVWEAKGMAVINTTRLVTAFTSNHLTSFATGFLPEVNSIDFNFIFAHASFEDNMTIFVSAMVVKNWSNKISNILGFFFFFQLMVILTFVFYFVLMIYATVRDVKDNKKVIKFLSSDSHKVEDNTFLFIL